MRLLLLFILLVTPALAQGTNVTLLSVADQYSQYNDIWGYTAPNGDEYALIGTTTGTAIYNAKNPSAPYRTGFISGPGSTWRDIKTFDQYAYVVTEGGGGVQIISLVNPEAPSLVRTWTVPGWGNTHNIAIDTGTGIGYACGVGSLGTVIFDLSNPTNPVDIGRYSAHYVHDLHVQNGLAHLSAINNGFYRIVDATSLATRDQITTLGSFTHNTWANASDTVCVTTDESGGGRLGLYDISNPNNIQLLSNFSIDPSATVHNAFIKGDRVYAAWYTAGFGCIDISNPSSPQIIGTYDTNSASGPGFSGAWGCYPFAPSGVIYVSDIQNGLYILEVNDPVMEIIHTPLNDTQNENGPYTVSAQIRSLQGRTITGGELHYRVNGGPDTHVPLQFQGGDTWAADIPGQPSPAVIDYEIEGEDDLNQKQRDPMQGEYVFSVGRKIQVYFNNFDGPTDEGWTHGQISTQDDWQRNVPQGQSGSSGGVPWSDPSSAFSGSRCWGNDLGPSGWNGQYQPNVSNWLESPSIDCSGRTGVTLSFQRWLTVEDGASDIARIRVNGTQVWANPIGYHPGHGGHLLDTQWNKVRYDISAIADNNPNVRVRFELISNSSQIELGGWNIDDFELHTLGPVNKDTINLTGTTNVNVGGTITESISNAPANAAWWLYWSRKQNGSIIAGHSFDIGPKVKTATTGTTNGAGSATWTSGPIPGKAAGLTIYLEARADEPGTNEVFDSNVVTLTIN